MSTRDRELERHADRISKGAPLDLFPSQTCSQGVASTMADLVLDYLVHHRYWKVRIACVVQFKSFVDGSDCRIGFV